MRERLQALNARIRRLNADLGHRLPPTTLAPLDVEGVLRRWREGRSAMLRVARAVTRSAAARSPRCVDPEGPLARGPRRAMLGGPLIRAFTAPPRGAAHMAVYKKIDVVGTSPTSFADATRAAVEEASKCVRNMSWFEVIEQRGAIRDGKVSEFQVTLRIGFKLE